MNDKEREAIGTVWHTTEKGKDIVSMHDYQYRALLATIAERDEAIRVLAEAVVENQAPWKDKSAITANPIANQAVQDARRGGT